MRNSADEEWIVSVGATQGPFPQEWAAHRFRAGGIAGVQVVQTPEEAARYAEEAARRGVRRIIAVGGDGTMHAVLNGVERSGTHCEVALVPNGTANDFARAAGIAQFPLDEAIALASRGTAQRIDVLHAGDRLAANMVTIGFAASLSDSVPRPLKDALGGLAYPIHGLQQLGSWNATTLTVRCDGQQWTGDALGVCICNGSSAGGGLPIAPDALLDDGLLDVVIFPDDGAWASMARLVEALTAGSTHAEGLLHFQCDAVEVTGAGALPMSFDGELDHLESLSVRIRAGGLTMPIGPTARLKSNDGP